MLTIIPMEPQPKYPLVKTRGGYWRYDYNSGLLSVEDASYKYIPPKFTPQGKTKEIVRVCKLQDLKTKEELKAKILLRDAVKLTPEAWVVLAEVEPEEKEGGKRE